MLESVNTGIRIRGALLCRVAREQAWAPSVRLEGSRRDDAFRRSGRSQLRDGRHDLFDFEVLGFHVLLDLQGCV